MKKTYHIGEVAKLFNISTEAIRFYEKEGLVHPEKGSKNGYRVFTLENIYELMDVIFYRKINLSIEEIRTISHNIDQWNNMREFVEQKERVILETIHSQRLLLQKIETLETTHKAIVSHLGHCSIMPLPSFYIIQKLGEKLFPSRARETLVTSKEFNLCTFGGQVVRKDNRWAEGCECILMKRKLAENLGIEAGLQSRPVIDSRRGAYTVFLAEGVDYMNRETVRLLTWMEQNGYQPADNILFNYMLAVYIRGKCHTYVELLAPIV